MEKLITISSTTIPLPIENVDTDQIKPARFLKAVTREGFGENISRDWKYDGNGSLVHDFVLNNPIYTGSVFFMVESVDVDPAENMRHGLCMIIE